MEVVPHPLFSAGDLKEFVIAFNIPLKIVSKRLECLVKGNTVTVFFRIDNNPVLIKKKWLLILPSLLPREMQFFPIKRHIK